MNFLIPLDAKRALLVSDSNWGLEELEGLLKTLGGIVVEKVKLNQPKIDRPIDPRTYIRSGKLAQLTLVMEANDLDLLLLDFDLSPSQLKNIEKITKRLVMDRTGIILEIFNRHARTKDAKLQVELARLQYLMPRLAHLWSHFERQRGSGGGSLKGKGMGEKQIEVDRRLIKDRVNVLKRKLTHVEEAKKLHQKHRKSILKAALVGYTNAGKSTLLNALTDSESYVEDTLFATLDAQVKLLNPKARPTVLAIDTVGFIDRLPHGLVASFHSTLSEVLQADLLVHVLDISHAEVRRHFDVTLQVLQELGAQDIPMLIVFNKADRVTESSSIPLSKLWVSSVVRKTQMSPLFISAFNKKDIQNLRQAILQFFERSMETYDVLIPFDDGKTAAKIFEVGQVDSKEITDKGTFFRVRTLPQFAEQICLKRYKV